MNDLSSKILRAESLREIDALLEVAFSEVEFIGELDINEDAFARIAEELRRNCRTLNWYRESAEWLLRSANSAELINELLQRNRTELKRQGRPLWSIAVDCLRPAVFVTSMVFGARYSHNDSRAFWKPYATEVWDIEYGKEFYDVCRAYFFTTARPCLTAIMGFDLFGASYGDLVRPVYRHAIVPAYVRDDFARWFARNLHIISGFSKAQLSEFLRGQNADDYAVKPLRNFLDNDDTHEIALEIIEELIVATNQLMAQQEAEDIRERFSSQIQRDLWDEYVSELGNRVVVSTSVLRLTRLEWVWSLEQEDWVLRLSNLITEAHEKPQTCVWSLATADTALHDWDAVSQEVWPEQRTDGQWRVREIAMNPENQLGMLNGAVYIYDDYNNNIFAQSVPALPENEFQLYRITQQGIYGVPIPFRQLAAGEYLVSYRDTLQLLDAENQVISPEKADYYVSKIMRDRVGHQNIARYEIELPLTIEAGDVKERVERIKRRISHPRLSGEHQVPNTSKRLPPVYTSNDLFIAFSDISIATTALNVRVSSPAGDSYKPFAEHAEKTSGGYRLHLRELIPADQIGTYAINITFGYRERLASPIEFSVAPNLHFSDISDEIFHPLNLPCIRVSNLTTALVESPDGSARVEAVDGGDRVVTWTDLRSPYCRLHILEGERVVPVEWQIRRTYAWLEVGGTVTDRLLPQDLIKSKIQLRALPNSRLAVYAGESVYTVDVKTRDEATIDLRKDQFRDILNEQRSNEVSLSILLNDEKWSFGTFKRQPHWAADQPGRQANVPSTRHTSPSISSATLLENLTREPPRYLDREALYTLATIQPGMLKRYNERPLKAVWYPLAWIAGAHRVQHQVQSRGWSPPYMRKGFLIRNADSIFDRLESERRNPKYELVMISADGYRSVHNEWKQRLHAGGVRLQSFVSVQSWANSLFAFFKQVDDSRARMLLHEMSAEIHRDVANELIRLDRLIIALAMVLRTYSLTQQSARLAIIKDSDVDRDQLMNLLESANRICPSLLEWALTWSELFIVRSTS